MHIKRWLTVLIEPKSRGEDNRRREFILNVLLASSTVIGLTMLTVVMARFIGMGSDYVGAPPLFALFTTLLFAGLWFLSRKGFYKVAAYLLVTVFLLLAFYLLYGWGILLPQGLLFLAVALIIASILLGTGMGAAITLLASLILILLGASQQAGLITIDASWMKTPGGLADAIGFSLTFAVVTVVSWLSNREIQRFNQRLQEEVAKATHRLRVANKNLKALDHAKDEFISMASHQLGTPLTAISGYLAMTLDEDERNLTPDQRQYVENALEAADRMSSMSSDLLNVSRLSAGRFVIRREPADLRHITQQQIDQLHHAAERKGLTLDFSAPDDLPLIPLDVSKTQQVIMNFIDNAIYYTEKGHVDIRLEQEEGRIKLTVTDTGIGVPSDEKLKLFTKFYRAANAKSARPDGTGLGLYLAKRVIEDQGGSIIFESKLGEGSTFGFTLPLE